MVVLRKVPLMMQKKKRGGRKKSVNKERSEERRKKVTNPLSVTDNGSCLDLRRRLQRGNSINYGSFVCYEKQG